MPATLDEDAPTTAESPEATVGAPNPSVRGVTAADIRDSGADQALPHGWAGSNFSSISGKVQCQKALLTYGFWLVGHPSQ
jgi:hypothetical protein